MYMIRRSEVWTRQPQVPCGINQSIPGLIVAGVPLLFCSRPISNINSQNIAKVITKSGRGAQYSAYSASEVYLGKSLSEYTLVAIADIANTNIERHLVDFDWYGNAWRGFQLRAINQTIEFIPFDSAGNPAFCSVNTVAQSSVIRPVVVVARQKAGIAKLDTSLGSASTSALATCRGLTSSLPVVVGQYSPVSDRNFSSDPISGYAVIDGFMSDAAVARIIDNPWQIFATERRTLFIPTTVATGNNTSNPSKGSLAISGYSPSIQRTSNQTVSPATGHGVLSTYIPSVQQSAGQVVAPGKGNSLLTGYSPSLVQNRAYSPGKGSVNISCYSPAVLQEAGQVVNPGKGSTLFSGKIPSILRTDHKTISPSYAHLSITGRAPSVFANVIPGSGATADEIWNHPKALTVPKFIALK